MGYIPYNFNDYTFWLLGDIKIIVIHSEDSPPQDNYQISEPTDSAEKATTFVIAFSLVEYSIELSNDFIEDWKMIVRFCDYIWENNKLKYENIS